MLSHFVVRPSTSLAAGAGGTSMLASGAERLPILSRLTSFSPPFGAAVRHRKRLPCSSPPCGGPAAQLEIEIADCPAKWGRRVVHKEFGLAVLLPVVDAPRTATPAATTVGTSATCTAASDFSEQHIHYLISS